MPLEIKYQSLDVLKDLTTFKAGLVVVDLEETMRQ